MTDRVVAIDWGSATSVVATSDGDLFPVIANNELSKKDTPTVVSFTADRCVSRGADCNPICGHSPSVSFICSRMVGQEAKDQHRTNIPNTVTDLVRLTGATQEEYTSYGETGFATSAADGRLHVNVSFNGAETKFTTEHVASMMLRRLVSFGTAGKPEASNTTVVVAVPPCYTPQQRQAMHDAAAIAGCGPLQLVDTLSAMAAAYHVKHAATLPESGEPVHVMVLSVGHAYTSCGVAALTTAGARLLSSVGSANLGGANMDAVIFQHCQKEVAAKHNVELVAASKAGLRALAACEKAKKVLSTIDVAVMDLVNVAPDLDVQVSMRREEFVEGCAPLAAALKELLSKAVSDAGVEASAIRCVEMFVRSLSTHSHTHRTTFEVGSDGEIADHRPPLLFWIRLCREPIRNQARELGIWRGRSCSLSPPLRRQLARHPAPTLPCGCSPFDCSVNFRVVARAFRLCKASSPIWCPHWSSRSIARQASPWARACFRRSAARPTLLCCKRHSQRRLRSLALRKLAMVPVLRPTLAPRMPLRQLTAPPVMMKRKPATSLQLALMRLKLPPMRRRRLQALVQALALVPMQRPPQRKLASQTRS